MFKEVPAQFDFPAAEREVLRFWEANDIYEKSLKQREGRPPFVFYEGPPTANGLPHPGHCLTRIIKDVFPRYQTMTGHYCHRKAGWDTHGLPVEAEVCKELGIHTKQEIEQYGIERFVKLCRESVFRYTKEWEELTRRLGFWINLDEAYVTYHQSYVESVWWALKTLFDRGLLYQGHKVVWWWPQGGTALSAGEVGQGYREIDDPSVYVLFPFRLDDVTRRVGQVTAESPEETLRKNIEAKIAEQNLTVADGHRISLLTWTTTPWTLPSNMFAAVHADFEYVFVCLSHQGEPSKAIETVVMARERFERLRVDLFEKKNLHPTPVFTCKGERLIDLRYEPAFPEFFYEAQKDWYGSVGFRGSGQQFPSAQPVQWKNHKAPLRGQLCGAADVPVAWRVVAANFVTLDQGTGIVHVAPAFGEDDYKLWQRQNYLFAGERTIPLMCSVAPDGTFTSQYEEEDDRAVRADMGKYAGRFCKDADRDLARDLKDRGLLLHQEQYRHDYPFCWRAEEDPLIQYARKSWFIRTTAFKDEFLANNARINWLPEHIRDGRFGNFLADNVDWALSRERFWGTPLPIWECEACGHQEAVASYAELLGKPDVGGTEAWEQARRGDPELIEDLKVHRPYVDAVTFACSCKPGARMRRVPEVIDCWFDSGCMPFAQWGYPHQGTELFKQRFPADFISEAIDQTRGWFYTLLAISTMLFGEQPTPRAATDRAATEPSRDREGADCLRAATVRERTPDQHATFPSDYPHPFRNCIVLGLIAGEDGTKLSKSKRNYKEPSHIFDREGADAMRWSMLSSQAPWTGARFKEDAIATDQREFLIKLYNVYSFFTIYANIDQWSPAEPADRPGEPSELDRWLLAELNQTIADVRAAMDRYENYPACRRLVDFVDALSNWYVRRSRDRFWRAGMDADKDAAYQTLWSCLVELSRLIAPFVPFFAETLYQNLYRPLSAGAPESVHLCDYPQPNEDLADRRLMDEMAIVREIASLGRAARMDAKIKVRQPLPVVEIVLADASHRDWLEGHLPLIADELNVKRIEFAGDADKYVTYQVKPNFRSLGPKFGKLAPSIKQTLATADAASLRRQLDVQGRVSLTVDARQVELTPDDVQITLQAKPGWTAAQGRQVVVVLSTEITDALKTECLAREVVHLIQNARKAEQLDYQARIRVRVNATGALAEAIRAHESYIRGETLATELTLDTGLADARHRGEVEGTPLEFFVEVA